MNNKFIVLFLFLFTFLIESTAQEPEPRVTYRDGMVINSCFDSLETFFKNGSGSLGQIYNNSACGLNYCQASVMTATRYSSPGTGLPTTVNISCLPAGFNTLQAYLWWSESSSNSSATATVTNPLSGTSSYSAAWAGSGADKCWSMGGTQVFRANVTSSVSGNGNYVINISSGGSAIDGITLLIIYTDPNVTWQGSLIINDGAIVTIGGNNSQTMSGFTACGNSTFATAFAIAGDLQNSVGPTHTTTLNGNNYTFNQNFWNYDEAATSVFAGQSTSSFGFSPPSGDCWVFAVMGLYFQTTTCVNCSPCSITLSTSFINENCGMCNGSATASPSGGVAPYTYQWNDPGNQTTTTATGLCAGTYNVMVTDAGGCDPANAFFTISNINSSISITTSVTNPGCFGGCNGTVSANASGGTSPYTYSWTILGPGQSHSGVCAGTYTVTVTDANGCTTNASVEVSQPNPIDLYAIPLDESCAGACDGQLFASVTGGTGPFTYTWSGGIGVGQSQVNICAGTYTVTVVDANGCIEQNTFNSTTSINSGGSVTASFTYNGNQCLTGNNFLFTNTGTTGVNYFWDFGDGIGTSTFANPFYSYSSAGSYLVTQTVSNGPCSNTYSLTITVYSEPTASIVSTDISCFGACDGLANLTVNGGTGPYTYSWSNSATTEDLSNLCTGTFTIIITDANGCTGSTGVTINEPPALTATTSGTAASCNGTCDGTATANPSGGIGAYTYSWNDPTFQTNATATGLCAGTVTVTVTDANGCTTTANYTVNQPNAIAITTSTVDATCGNSDGSASANVNGGTSPYTYSWNTSPLQTGSTATALSSGSYTVTVTDANGCTQTATVNINDLGGGGSASITVNTNVSCNGDCDGQATASISGGTPPYTYLWDDPGSQTTTTATGLCAITYSVSVTDASGCVASASITITQPPALNASVTGSNDASCNGTCDGDATASVSGGTGAYTYLWNNAGNSTTAATSPDLCANTPYTVTVTDANGCIKTANVTINEPSALSASISGTNVSCNGSSDGAADLTVTGGTSPYNYLWSNLATSEDIINLTAGPYDVTATDAKGCTIAASVNIIEPAAIILSTSVNDASCGLANGSTCVTPSGGTPSYNYLWNDTSAQTTDCATALIAGTFIITVTDANGCTSTTTLILNDIPGGSAVISSFINASGFGICDGQATVNLTSGTLPYTYLWNDPGSQTTAIATGLCAGTWCVTVTDAVGCTDNTCITISEPPPIITSIVGTGIDCNGNCNGTADLTVAGGLSPYTYVWTPGGYITQYITGLCASIYYVTITDANSVSVTDSIVINQPSPVTVSVTGNDAICNGACDGNTAASVTGGTGSYTYLWDDTYNQTTLTATGLCAGTYNVTVTDVNECAGSNNITINEPPAIVVSITTISANCGQADGSATASVTNGIAPFTYNWNNGCSSQSCTGLLAGTHTVTVTDANGCTGTGTGAVSDAGGPSATISDSIDVSCQVGSDGEATVLIFDGTPPYTYLWNDPGSQTTTTATGLDADIYTVEITDNNGCITTESVTINEPSILVANTSPVSEPSCYGASDGIVMVTASGGTGQYTYLWDPPAGGQTTAMATGLSAGTYNVTVTDANNCISNTSVTLNEPAPLTLSITKADANCYGSCDGFATVSVGGGIPPYTYSWSNGDITQVADSLCAAIYNITVTDDNSCTAFSSFIINEPPDITVSISSFSDIDCYGNCNGFAQSTVSGGTPPYTYSWSDGQSSDQAINLCAGTYTITVSDNNGCYDVASITLTEPFAFTGAITDNDVSCFGDCNGNATVNVSGGASPYNYLWDDITFQTTPTADSLCDGTYTVTITDINGCVITSSVLITQPQELSLVSGSNTSSTCGFQNGSACVNVAGGVFPYTIVWNDPMVTTGPCIDSVFANVYNPIVTDANFCTATLQVIINDIVGPDIDSIKITDIPCYGDNNGTANVYISAGTSPFTYLWRDNNGDTVAMGLNDYLFGLSGGSYTVTVIDANGCVESDIFVLNEPSPLGSAILWTNDASCYGTCDGSASVIAGGGTPPYTYFWSPGGDTVDMATVLCPGSINILITDTNGCITTNNTVINQPDELVIIPVVTDVSCNGFNDGQISVSPTGGTQPYTYNWLPIGTGGNVTTVTNLDAGSYLVTVTDNNWCGTVENMTVNEPTQLISAGGSTPSNCGNANGVAYVNPSGGTLPYAYQWLDDLGNPIGQNTETATNLSAGAYDVTVTDDNGCTFTLPVTVGDNSGPEIAFITTTDVSCNGGNNGTASVVIVGGTLPYYYLWDDLLTLSNDTATWLTAGTYTVNVTDLNGCVDSATTTVNEPELIEIFTSGDTIICYSVPVEISASATGGTSGTGGPGSDGYTYSWNNGLPDSNIHIVSPLVTTTYIVTVTDLNGCTASQSFTLALNQIVSDFSSSVSCKGESTDFIDLSYSANGNIISWNWNFDDGNTDNSQNPSHIYSDPGTYYVTLIATDDLGCIDDTTKPITVNPVPTVGFGWTCEDPPIPSLTRFNSIVSDGSPPYTYEWDFDYDGITFDVDATVDMVTHSYDTSVSFNVGLIVYDNNGCSNNITSQVQAPPTAAFIMTPTETMTENPVIFTDNSFYNIVSREWDFGEQESNSNYSSIQNPQHSYESAGTHNVILKVTDTNGCVDTAMRPVWVKSEFVLFVPSAFSPNDDSKNEVFFPKGIGVYGEEFKMYIYDRWGDLIYETEGRFGEDIGWDGKANRGENIAQMDVYIWLIRTEDLNGDTHEFIGHVTLIK
ncbi:MAG: PKD domain-containing protein [Bacteroidota bacterium]